MVRRVVTLTCAEPPGEARQWSGRALAKTTGVDAGVLFPRRAV
jgi:hypothetical protein